MCDSNEKTKFYFKNECTDCKHYHVCKYTSEYDAIKSNTDLEHLPQMIELEVRCKYWEGNKSVVKKPNIPIMGKESNTHTPIHNSGISIKHTKVPEHMAGDEI